MALWEAKFSYLLLSFSLILVRMIIILNCCSITKLFCCMNSAYSSFLLLTARLLNYLTLFTLLLSISVRSISFILRKVVFITRSCLAFYRIAARLVSFISFWASFFTNSSLKNFITFSLLFSSTRVVVLANSWSWDFWDLIVSFALRYFYDWSKRENLLRSIAVTFKY